MAAAYFWPFAHAGDAGALAGFESLDRPWLQSAGHAFLQLCNPVPFASLALVTLISIARLRSLRHALAAWVLLTGANVSSQLLKPLLAHPRPHGAWHIHPIPPAAFPSGHTTAAMSLVLAIVLATRQPWRPVAAVVGGTFVLAVAFCVLILGWHYPSDAIGGFLLATCWALVVLAGMRWAGARWPQSGGMRRAAREAIALPRARIVLRAIGVIALVAVAVAATRAGELASFAGNHHALVFVAAAITVSAVTLLAGVTTLSNRRR